MSQNESATDVTWFSMALRFLGSLTTVSCNSAIFFIFPSMSIFCSSPRTWDLSRRTVSSFPWRLASSEALAEWMAVTQFSRSVWLLAWKGGWEQWGYIWWSSEVHSFVSGLRGEVSDLKPNKSYTIAIVLLLYYSIIDHTKFIVWQDRPCWIDKPNLDKQCVYGKALYLLLKSCGCIFPLISHFKIITLYKVIHTKAACLLWNQIPPSDWKWLMDSRGMKVRLSSFYRADFLLTCL